MENPRNPWEIRGPKNSERAIFPSRGRINQGLKGWMWWTHQFYPKRTRIQNSRLKNWILVEQICQKLQWSTWIPLMNGRIFVLRFFCSTVRLALEGIKLASKRNGCFLLAPKILRWGSRKITIIPKPELRGRWGDSLPVHDHLGWPTERAKVATARLRWMMPKKLLFFGLELKKGTWGVEALNSATYNSLQISTVYTGTLCM